MIRPIVLKPTNPDIELLFNNFYNMHHPHGKAMRISRNTASMLSKNKAARELINLDVLDITHRDNGPKRSIVYLNHNVKIEKKNNTFVFRI